MERQTRVGLAVAILLIALACAPLLPSVAPAPTRPAGAVGTMVIGTKNAASTQTALSLPPSNTPTSTLAPSKTPTLSPTPTATFLFLLPTFDTTSLTNTGSSSRGTTGGKGDWGDGGGGGTSNTDENGNGAYYSCAVLRVDPPSGTVFSPGQTIGIITWTIKNNGKYNWNPEIEHPNLDFVHISGPTLQTFTRYDIHPLIRTGDIVKLQLGQGYGNPITIRPAKAPTEPGEYAVGWALSVDGGRLFCKNLKFYFIVE